MGITDVTIIAADQINRRGDEAISEARHQIATLPVCPVVDTAAASPV